MIVHALPALLRTGDGDTSAAIIGEPFWITLIKVVAVFGFLMLMTLFTIVAERKVVARMQVRIGPNRVGPRGSLQSLADGIKLMLKEDIVPALADKVVFILAPIVSVVPAFLAWSIIPLGGKVSMFGHRTALQLTDLPVGVLFALACSSLGVYGIVLAGWASGSTYPLLGGLRSAAQMISYEVSMGLSLVGVFLFAGSLSTAQVVAQQHDVWYCLVLAPSFIIYAISAIGETNRAPFDLPEAESELVGGFHTEYSSIKFAFFFLAEYINLVTVSAVAATLFLGGFTAPPGISRIPVVGDNPWFGLLWFLVKVLLFVFGFIWLRGTLPRLRYDQFMHFGWKGLVPFSLAWIILVAAVRTVTNEGYTTRQILIYGGIAFAVLVLASLLIPSRKEPAKSPAQPYTLDAIPLPPGTGGAPSAPVVVGTVVSAIPSSTPSRS